MIHTFPGKPDSHISAALVTKCWRPELDQIVKQLRGAFSEVVVWDNAQAPYDMKVLGRYVAIASCKGNLIYTQDDDCSVDIDAFLYECTAVAGSQILPEMAERARLFDLDSPEFTGWIVTNMPKDRREFYSKMGTALIGWGALFYRAIPHFAFSRYARKFQIDPLFLRECDRVFTGLSNVSMVDVPYTNFDIAHAADRMGRDPNHLADLAEISTRIKSLK